MLIPTKPRNYPLIIMHVSLLVKYSWFGAKRLASPWLKWFTWEMTNVSDIFILGDSTVSEKWLDDNGIFFTDYTSEEEIKEMGGVRIFIDWLQYGSHPIQVFLPDKEGFRGVQDAVYYNEYRDVEMYLFQLVHQLRKL